MRAPIYRSRLEGEAAASVDPHSGSSKRTSGLEPSRGSECGTQERLEKHAGGDAPCEASVHFGLRSEKGRDNSPKLAPPKRKKPRGAINWIAGRSQVGYIHRIMEEACTAHCKAIGRTWNRITIDDRARIAESIVSNLPAGQQARWRLYYEPGDILNPNQTPNIRPGGDRD